MNDDLHSIDDLFRKRLEEYNEMPPPSAWEEVSHDLDRQQASFYKSKYNRLKWAALLLLLLCFAGATYVTFDVAKNHLALSKQDKEKPTIPLSDNRNKDKKVDITERKNGQNRKQHNEPNDAVADTVSATNLLLSTEDQRKALSDANTIKWQPNQLQTEEQNKTTSDAIRIKKTSNMPSLSSVLALIDEKREPDFFTENSVVNQTENTHNEPLFLTHRSLLLSSDLQPVFPEGKVDSVKLITDLSTLSAHHTYIGLQTNATSAVRLKPKTTPRFSLSLFAAPGFSFTQSENDHHRGGRGNSDKDKDEQSPVFFSSGILMTYSFTHKWSLESGVSVMTSSTSIKPKTVYAKADDNGHVRYELNCSSGVTYLSPKNNAPLSVGDSAMTSGSTSRLVYITLPLSLSYRIGTRHFSFFPALGADLNVLANGKIKTGFPASESTTTSIEGLKRNYLNAHIGLGVEYELTRKLSIGIRPDAKFSLTPINKETPVKSYQNYIGIEAAVRMKF